MPLYEYECDACGRRFEVILKNSDTTVETCKHCGKGPVHRQLSSPAIQFKGTGWYVTDYAQKGKSDSSSTSSTDKKTDGATSDTSSQPADGSSTPKSDSSTAKSDSGTPKSDTAASSPKPSTGGASKDSKE
jgi:putative FmdB family regulatory protein